MPARIHIASQSEHAAWVQQESADALARAMGDTNPVQVAAR
jgi:hypothetical protein